MVRFLNPGYYSVIIMKSSTLKGISFGLTSGIITTLGLIVGLHSFSGEKLVILGGILTIAIADSFSDALGIHISEESEKSCEKKIWGATFATFLSKLIFSSTFMIPVLLFELNHAIIISIIWGLTLLGILSFLIAKDKKEKPFKVISEHLFIAIVVIALTHYIGEWISVFFS